MRKDITIAAEHRASRGKNEARRLRVAGCTRLEARGAALLPSQARGWTASATLRRDSTPRDGRVWVHYGPCAFVGWIVVSGGSPPTEMLGLVRHF